MWVCLLELVIFYHLFLLSIKLFVNPMTFKLVAKNIKSVAGSKNIFYPALAEGYQGFSPENLLK